MSKIYDVIVLGAGPAGLAAGLYAGRSRLSVLIVEKGQDGGQISITDEIENYPGQVVDQPESGPSLIARMTEQAKKFGAERVSDTIKEVRVTSCTVRNSSSKELCLAFATDWSCMSTCSNDDILCLVLTFLTFEHLYLSLK